MKKIIKEVVSRDYLNRLNKIRTKFLQISKIEKELQKLGVKLIISVYSGDS